MKAVDPLKQAPPFRKQSNKLLWHCRRGMLELDVLLKNFITDTLTSSEEEVLMDFLSYSDQALYEWIIKQESAPTAQLQSLADRIRDSM